MNKFSKAYLKKHPALNITFQEMPAEDVDVEIGDIKDGITFRTETPGHPSTYVPLFMKKMGVIYETKKDYWLSYEETIALCKRLNMRFNVI